MATIISPDHFRKVPWKNGKGETIELAINPGGSLSGFEWRLSMADVVEDGAFSDFTGYQRNLVLIKGNGIELIHDQGNVVRLENVLDSVTFDGGRRTVGKLIKGPITDFNVMTNQRSIKCEVKTFSEWQQVSLIYGEMRFVFGLSDPITLSDSQGSQARTLPPGHLLQSVDSHESSYYVTGRSMIVIYFAPN